MSREATVETAVGGCGFRARRADVAVALTDVPTYGKRLRTHAALVPQELLARALHIAQTRSSMSPRKLTAETTFTDLESEVMFTIAGLGADPDARPLVGETADWLGWIDAAQKEDRAFRQQEANVEAGRVVANGRLDLTCITFGRRLLGACEQDRESPRFKRFFAKPPLAFVKQALAKQVTAVFGWLSVNDDDVLEAHRLDLQERATSARAAQDATSALGPLRGTNQARRAKLADDLTRERDGLHRQLAEIADEKNLGRTWADLFFKKTRRDDEEEVLSPAPMPT